MRINEIIVENQKDGKKFGPEITSKLQALRDIGQVTLANEIQIQLARFSHLEDPFDAADIAARAKLRQDDENKKARRARRDARLAGYKADKEKFKVKTDKDDKPEGPGRGKYTQYKDGSDRKSAPAPKWEPAKSDGSGTGAKIAKALNPLSDLDSTDLGTVATSALSKASAKFRNKDLFKSQPSKRK